VTTVSLAELLAARDDSLRVRRSPLLARLLVKARRIDVRPALRALAIAAIVVFRFGVRHGLVLAACTAFVVGAATLSITAAWAVAGAALFFLEARRR
jgi:hypothetical protein